MIFCIHESSGQQQNFGAGDYNKSARSLSPVGPATYNNNFASNGQRITVEDTPDEFEIKKPATQDKGYNDFLSFLYRGDKVKSKAKREINQAGTAVNGVETRGKRAIIFRCLLALSHEQ